MAVTHQLEITAAEADAALSTNEAIDAKIKDVEAKFREKFGEVTPERQQEYTVALRVVGYYAVADPAGLRGRLASVLPGDTVVIGGDAPPWYYTLAIQQALKFNPGLIMIQINPEEAVTVYSSVISDVPTHVGPNRWRTREEIKPIAQAETPAIEEPKEASTDG